MKNILLSGLGLLLFLACKNTEGIATRSANSFNVESLKPVITELGKTWGKAIKSKDINLLKNLYDAKAHYLPDDQAALHGNAAIVNYWESSFPFMGDLVLHMNSLEGTKELLYETGKGVAQVMNEKGEYDDFKFKYVNVWKLQTDGTYKVVIDTYNSLPNE